MTYVREGLQAHWDLSLSIYCLAPKCPQSNRGAWDALGSVDLELPGCGPVPGV